MNHIQIITDPSNYIGSFPNASRFETRWSTGPSMTSVDHVWYALLNTPTSRNRISSMPSSYPTNTMLWNRNHSGSDPRSSNWSILRLTPP